MQNLFEPPTGALQPLPHVRAQSGLAPRRRLSGAFLVALGLFTALAMLPTAAQAQGTVTVTHQRTTIFNQPDVTYRSFLAKQALDPSLKQLAFPEKGTELKVAPSQKSIEGEDGIIFYPVEVPGKPGVVGWVSGEAVVFKSAAPPANPSRGEVAQKDCPPEKSGSGKRLKETQRRAAETIVGDLSEMRYSNCTSENNYLESGFRAAPFAKDALDERLPPQCTYELLRAAEVTLGRGDSGIRMRECTGKKASPVEKPACLSAAKHRTIHNNLVKLSKCMDLEPKQLLGKLAKESKLQVNVKSGTGASGISQLTGDLIQDINLKHRSLYLNRLKSKSDSDCQVLHERLSKSALSPVNDCTSLEPPENPTQSFFYGMIYYQEGLLRTSQILLEASPEIKKDPALVNDPKIIEINQRLSQLKLELTDLKERAKRIQKGQPAEMKKIKDRVNEVRKLIPAAERAKSERELEILRADMTIDPLLREVTNYGYNWGHGEASAVFRTYLASTNGRIQYPEMIGANGGFLSAAKSYFKKEVARGRKTQKRADEQLNYVHVSNPKVTGGASSISSEVYNLNRTAGDRYGLKGDEPCAAL